MKKLILLWLILCLSTTVVYAADEVLIEIPDFDVRVNGQLIKTSESTYPVILYNNVTYFPMTSDYLAGIGLGLTFSNEDGLSIQTLDKIGAFEQKFLGATTLLKSQHTASTAPFKLMVNGNMIDNKSEVYPILLYKDITYFPMTWRFAVEEFGWTTSWDNDTGFSITMPDKEIEHIRRLLQEEKMPLNQLISLYSGRDDTFKDKVMLEVNRVHDWYDYDKDGLLDYDEIYRNFTDPNLADTDGDGRLDGDWEERQEYTYTIALDARLIEPYDLDFMASHLYQDIQVIEETDDYVDLKILLYPYNKYDQTLVANSNWQADNATLSDSILSGQFNDWDETMRKDLLDLLHLNGIYPDQMTDMDLVIEIVNLFETGLGFHERFEAQTDNHPDFHMYDWYIEYVDGKAVLNQALESSRPEVIKEIETEIEVVKASFEKNTGKTWSTDQVLSFLGSPKQMFYERMHGSCSTTSSFYANVFQALGIPAKVMPYQSLVDTTKADDEKEKYDYYMETADQLDHTFTKESLKEILDLGGSGHITNLVYIGNRWVNVDIAGGQKFNYSSYDGNRLVFFKQADYDYYESSVQTTDNWLLLSDAKKKNLAVSDNFSGPANNPVNNLGNFSYKLYDLSDQYGVHIKPDIKNYVDAFDVNTYYTDMYASVYFGLDTNDQYNDDEDYENFEKKKILDAFKNEVYYSFNAESPDLFDQRMIALFDTRPVQLSVFSGLEELNENFDQYFTDNSTLFIDGHAIYDDLPNDIKAGLSKADYMAIDDYKIIDYKKGIKVFFYK